MTDLPVLLDKQGLRSAPQQEGLEVDTNLIVPPLTMTERLAHFPDDIYDLSAESHLIRLVKVLLGEAGAGRLSKPNVLARLQQSIYGSHFYDLDRFYGALFGAQRRVAEILDGNPMVDPHTDEEWEDIGARDDSYRARMEQFVKAIALGATPAGMELVAEALLNVDCDVYESFVVADRTIHSYSDVEAIGTYASLNAFGTYSDFESDDTLPSGHMDRYVFTVVPKREITEEERYDLIRVLSVLKPAQSIVKVSPLGVPTIEPVRIRSVSADSEYWRIVQRTTRGADLDPKLRPAFAAYQGEAFTHLTAAAGVSSYTLKDDGSIDQFNVFGVVRLDRTPPGRDLFKGHEGVTGYAPYNIIFTADLAIAPWETILAGRMVSDGILTRNAYASAIRGAKNFLPVYTTQQYANLADDYSINLSKPQSLSGLYSDGYGLYTSGRWVFWGSFRTHQRFWATPERRYRDTTREVVELRLRTPRLVNYVSLELARFPHSCMVQAWSDEVGDWVTLKRWSVTESYPEVIPNRPNYADTHPQHALSGHWQKFSSGTDAVRTDRLRVVLRRSDPASFPTRGTRRVDAGPQDGNGRTLAYSLAVKNWDVGYRIKDRTDIPEPDETLGAGFATTIDAKGNTVVLDVVENRAADLLTSNTRTWRSEPQPTNRAVVNLYLDTRNPDGTGQVVDRFYLDPAKSGPHLNLYYTEREDYGSFPASNAELEASTGGSVTPLLRGGLKFGANDPAWIEVDNDEIHFDPSANWWTAMQFRPAQPTSTIEGVMGLFTLDDKFSVFMANDVIEGVSKIFVLGVNSDGDLAASATALLEAATGEVVTVSLSYVRDQNRLFLTVKNGDIISRTDVAVNGTIARPETLYVGGHPIAPGSNLTLDRFFLKVGVLRDPIESLVSNFDSYLLKAAPGVRTNDYTQNAVIRYHPSFSASTADQPDLGRLGLRGGPADFLANAVWHPIEREYKLTKGYINLPPTRAKFWKMEFTNLVPEPIESFVPINRRVRLYPPDISGIGYPPAKAIGDQWPGLRQAIVAAGSTSFTDRPFNPAKVWTGYRPTAVQHATDPRQAKTMRNASWLFGWQQWQVGSSAPRFHEVGPHVYDEFDIVDTSKIGYFVALKEVRAHRTDYRTDDDTKIYREHFHDDSNMEDGYTWNLDPGHMYGDQGAVATSKPLVSRHPVRAIQFAATQSDAVQIVPDDDFRDERLSETDWDDDTMWHRVGDAVARYSPTDYSVIVNRNLTLEAGGGSAQGLTFGKLPHEMVYPVFAQNPDEDAPEAVTQTDGGIESALAFTSPKGMLHAAARVTGITDTVNPLVLQIVGSDGTVLAEAERYVKKGETVEWSVPYQLGSFTRAEVQAYERRSIVDTMVAPYIPDEAAVPTGDTPEPAVDELVRVRLVQSGTSTDSWKIDRLSIFDDSLLWEFSVDGGDTWYEALDIRSNPNGVLAFPTPSTSLRWRVTAYRDGRAVTSLQIRPWYEGQFATVLGQPHRGPNVSSFDHEPPIQNDPEFNVWSNPVPRWWWIGGRKFPILPVPGQPLTNPYSNFYSRSASEEIPAVTDTGTGALSAQRIAFNGQDDDGFNIYTEPVDQATDAASRQVVYRRTASESVPPIEDEGHRSILHDDTMLRPPVSPINEDN